MKKTIAVGIIAVLFASLVVGIVPSSIASPDDWIITGDTVEREDANVYMGASPHTISSGGWVYFDLVPKTYTGDIDAVWGFNLPNVKPTKAELYHPHYVNWTTQHSQFFYNVTNITNPVEPYECTYGNSYNPLHKNVTHHICSEWNGTTWRCEAYNLTTVTVCFDSYEQNATNYTAYWHTKHSRFENWLDISSSFTKVNYDYGGMNTWYYVKNLPVVAGKSYQVRAWVDIAPSLNKTEGKYWWAVKPSSETIPQAIANNHFYALDPWIDDSGWLYRKTINLTGQAGAGTHYQVNLSIGDSSGGDFHLEGHCTDFPNDTVVTDNDQQTKLPLWIEDPTVDPIQMWVNVSDDLNASQDVCIYYGKSGESSASHVTNTFLFGDDFPGSSLDTDKWSLKDGSCSVTSGYAQLYGAYPLLLSKTFTSDNGVLHVKFSQTSAPIGTAVAFRSTDDALGDLDFYSPYLRSNNNLYLTKIINTAVTSFNDKAYTQTTGTYELETSYNGNDLNLDIWDDGVHDSLSATADGTRSDGRIGVGVFDTGITEGELKFYYFFVRKFNDPEPAFSSAGSEEGPSTLEIGNNIAITNDWGQTNNSNISVTVSGSTAENVNVTYNDTRFTNVTDWGDKAVGAYWDNQSISHGNTVGNVYVEVQANTTSSGGTNDTEYFWLNTTKRTNTATMDSSATQSVNTNEDFFVNASCVEEYGDTFYGDADLLEDDIIILTETSITDYVNFTHNESSADVYNYTVRFYNTSYYDNATTATHSNVTVSTVPVLEIGNNVAIDNDWGQTNNSNISITVSGSTAENVNVTYNDTRFTNATDWGDKAVGAHWDNQSISHGNTVGDVYVEVKATTTSSGGTNDTEYFWFNTTKRTNTATMDSSATQEKDVNQDFHINATCNEEYGDTFYGDADLLEDGSIVLTETSIIDYVNFTHNESSADVYNYTVRFYNTSYYDNATTSTYSTVTVSDLPSPVLTTGNISNVLEDWGQAWNSNFSASTTVEADNVWMNFTNAEFTNGSLENVLPGMNEWVNESHNVGSPVTNISVTVTLNSTTSGSTNDTDTFWYEITKRSNTATMDSAATQSVDTNENFWINATITEEYGDEFNGGADLLEDGDIISTDGSVINHVNFSRSEGGAGQYNFTVRFYNTTHYDNATTPTYSNVTVSTAATTPSISNVLNGSVSFSSHWVAWDVNQSCANRWKYSLYENMSGESWSNWDNDTTAPNITVTGLTASTTYYFQAWSYNTSDNSLTDNSSATSFTTSAAASTPTISNVLNGSVSFSSHWVDWDVDQSCANRWKYSVYENMSSESWSNWDNDTAAPNITVTGLSASTTYYFQAWSYNTSDNSLTDNSSATPFTTPIAASTPSVSNVLNGSVSFSSHWVNWDVDQSCSNRWRYSLYENMSGASWSNWDNTTASPNITATGLSASTTYYFQAWAYNTSDNSLTDNSSTTSFTTPSIGGGTTPSISNVTPSSVNSTAQWVSWVVNQSCSNRWKYSLYENMGSSSWSSWENATTTPNITVSNLSAVKHYYQAWSYNSTDEGLTDNSTTANFTVDATAPTISEMAHTPSSVLVGDPVTITCTVVDGGVGVKNASIQIKDAKDRVFSYSLVAGANNSYAYEFTYTGKSGWYYIQYFRAYDENDNLREESSTLSFSARSYSAGGVGEGGGAGGEVPTPMPDVNVTAVPDVNATATPPPMEWIRQPTKLNGETALMSAGVIVGFVFILLCLGILWNFDKKKRRERRRRKDNRGGRGW